jgi:hypothetical protein
MSQDRDVVGYLKERLKQPNRVAMPTAVRLAAKERVVQVEKQAEWREQEYPSALASTREGLTEISTVSRLGLSRSRHGAWFRPT